MSGLFDFTFCFLDITEKTEEKLMKLNHSLDDLNKNFEGNLLT